MSEEKGCIGSRWGNRREGYHWGDLDVDGWIILGWISRRWDVGIWTGLGSLRIGIVGGRLLEFLGIFHLTITLLGLLLFSNFGFIQGDSREKGLGPDSMLL